uniref:Peptidase M56, BlaR1 n=1 Tax=Solibacter usitatus (strain Ellin6076) TaxID=234267 RepID=Q029G9_SOLUE
MMSKIGKSLFIIWAVASFSRGQQPSGTATPEFEVASLKPSTPATGEVGGVYTYPGGRVEFRGCTLQYLIEQAFSIQPFQVSGGPGWMQQERYDIDAEPPASSKSSKSMPPYPKAPPNEEQRQMLQSLLVGRFGLKYHRETREGPVYLLVKGNKALKLVDSKDKNRYPWAGGIRGGMITGDGLAGINESMEDLAKRLSPYLGRPVLDRTGLSGSFDFRSEYSSDDVHPDVITMILSSVQDLGLKLTTSKGPVDGIVIEHAERPSAN